MSFLTLLTKKVAKISLSIEIVEILIDNDIIFTLLVKQVENDMFSTIVHNYTRYEAQTKN
jgi:hypothetical protein